MQITSLYNGMSGIKAYTNAITSVSDNLANQSTTGFKATRALFGDIMASQLATGTDSAEQYGNGVYVTANNVMTQGSIVDTDSALDLAINGNGFFIVKPETEDGFYYTRDGSFGVDKDGYLVNQLGYRVQGTMGAGGVAGTGDLQFDFTTTSSVATSLFEMTLNLDATDTDYHDQDEAAVPSDTESFNYAYGLTAYDANGDAHQLVTYYQRLDSYSGDAPAGSAHVWKATVYEETDGVYSPNPLTPTNSYYLHFDTDGHLVGTSTSYGATGDDYRSEASFSSTAGNVSDRLGESLSFTGASDQTYTTRATVTFAGATAGTETVTVGGTTYTLGANATAADAANDLASQINNDATLGVYAVANAGEVTLYAKSGAASSDLTVSGSGLTLDDDTTLAQLVSELNSGLAATGVVDLTNLIAGDTVTVAGTTFTEGVDFSDAATLAAAINAAALGVTASDNGGNGVYLTASSVGAAGNAITLAASGTLGISGASLLGGLDDSATSLVEASSLLDSGAYYLDLARSDTGAAATLTTGAANTLGAGLGLDFNTYTQVTAAADGTTSAETDGTVSLAMTFNGAAQTIAFDYTPADGAGSTQSAGSSEMVYVSTDGADMGALSSITVDKYGNVIGTYGDGSTETLATVSLAGFKNPEGLQRVGDNLWIATAAAGDVVVALAGGAEGLGTIEAGALEQANVDLAQEFVNMINYQRAYQANSKSITTSDEMLKTAINLKS